MKTPTCLYAKDGSTVVIDASEVDSYLSEGWADTPDAFVSVAEVEEVPDDAPPTRAELEEAAKAKGIKFDGRTSDAKLEKLINEAQ